MGRRVLLTREAYYMLTHMGEEAKINNKDIKLLLWPSREGNQTR